MNLRATLKSLGEKWKNYLGDRETEVEIRKHLIKNGLAGKSAKILNYKLIAVQRPGWVQIYRFEILASAYLEDDESDAVASSMQTQELQMLYGLTKDDGRARTKIRTFDNREDRISLFEEWSDGMLILRRQEL